MNQIKLTEDVLEVKNKFFEIEYPYFDNYFDNVMYYCRNAILLLPENSRMIGIDVLICPYIEGPYSLESLDWFENDADINGCFAMFITSYFLSLNYFNKISKDELFFCESIIAGLLYAQNISHSR
ncbi:hypothetical protein [Armatimonas sp.]|uniref:hypothetical protein n=1 Tax=Armatimonas sp. TaxID=1872638 RepID=UPI00374D6939